ncbi:LysR family transcriptional regulator [Asaia prunellae]|uniref:LysR family transcriptional regulator n=1 Tax=Asaia prunellae TaxID=610245 RepID=UPI00046FF552|nr:LysR family transcriptional regulator [Asaia prunellae]
MKKKINFNAMIYFISVVEAGSVSAAARTLGVSKSVISKSICDLELSLQTSLLVRTSKQILPTRAGEAFYKQCIAGVRTIEAAYLDAQYHGASPQGELRVLANAAYGRYVVFPVIQAFAERYPECRVSFKLADDVSEANMVWFDVAIRTRSFENHALHVRRIGSFKRQIVIGREHRDRFGPIETLDCLRQLPFIDYVNHIDQSGWTFTNGLSERHVQFQSRITLGPINLVLESVMDGQGFSVLPDFLCEHEALSPRLVHLLPDWSAQSGSILAYTYPTRQRLAAVRLFVEWVACAAQGIPFPN